MFDTNLPTFFDQDMLSFFNGNIADLYKYKDNDHFTAEVLDEFIKITNELETVLLEYANVMGQKVKRYEDLENKFKENNDELRNINDQSLVVKISRKTFGESILKDQYSGVIDEELIGGEN